MYKIGLSTPCGHITEENLASYRAAGLTVMEISDGMEGYACFDYERARALIPIICSPSPSRILRERSKIGSSRHTFPTTISSTNAIGCPAKAKSIGRNSFPCLTRSAMGDLGCTNCRLCARKRSCAIARFATRTSLEMQRSFSAAKRQRSFLNRSRILAGGNNGVFYSCKEKALGMLRGLFAATSR